MKKIILICIVIFLSSCFEREAVRVTIIDKSFNKDILYQQAYNQPYKQLNIEQKYFTKIHNKNPTIRSFEVIAVRNKKPASLKIVKPRNSRIINKNSTWITPVYANVYKYFSKKHKGITFSTKDNSKISSIASGKVVYSGNNLKSYGFMVIIKHEHGFYSHYMFNKKSLVEVGDSINKGQTIAITGINKFHLSLKKFTTFVDPEKYINFN